MEAEIENRTKGTNTSKRCESIPETLRREKSHRNGNDSPYFQNIDSNIREDLEMPKYLKNPTLEDNIENHLSPFQLSLPPTFKKESKVIFPVTNQQVIEQIRNSSLLGHEIMTNLNSIDNQIRNDQY